MTHLDLAVGIRLASQLWFFGAALSWWLVGLVPSKYVPLFLNSSLHCNLLLTRELDVSGIGVCDFLILLILKVRVSLALQTAIVFLIVALGDNLETKRTFLMMNRIARTMFLGVQVIQLLRRQISFYDLLILSHIQSFLAIPFLVAQVPSRLSVSGFVLYGIRTLVMLYSLAVSSQGHIQARCSWPQETVTSKRSPPRLGPAEWEGIGLLILIMLELESLYLVAQRICAHVEEDEAFESPIHDPVISIMLMVWLSVRLEMLIYQFDQVTEPVQQSWPMGQITAMFGLLPVAIAL